MRTAFLLALPALLASQAPADTITVTQVNLDFVPADITINAGDTVEWVWTSGFHSVTEGTDGTIDGDEAFHEFLGNTIFTYSVTFDAAFLAANPRPNNRYDYFCQPHFFVNQKGVVNVDVSGPVPYCTAKTSSSGCSTAIATTNRSAHPISGAANYSVTASSVQGFKNGLAFAGITGPAALPFSGGTLCVSPPTKRGPIQNSGGSAPGACDGTLATLVNDGNVIPLGLDAGPGNSGWYQWWYRDPQNGAGNLGTALSNAIQLDFQ